jgi:hypothetical protein
MNKKQKELRRLRKEHAALATEMFMQASSSSRPTYASLFLSGKVQALEEQIERLEKK